MNILTGIGKKEKMGVAIAAVVVFAAIFDRIIISPICGNFRKIGSEIKVNERQLAQGLRNIKQKDDILKEYQKYLPYIKSDYSEGEEVAKLLEEIEGMGRRSGISIADIKPRPMKKSDIYRYYFIEIEAVGTMEAVMDFLHKLGSSKELYRAGRVSISIKNKETSTVKASILVTKVVVS